MDRFIDRLVLGAIDMSVLILKSPDGDWEGLFINGNLISEGHKLTDGDELYLLKISEEYNFTSKDVRIGWVEDNEKDVEYLMSYASFPTKLSELNGEY